MSYFENKVSTVTIKEEAYALKNFESAYQGQGIIEKYPLNNLVSKSVQPTP